MARTSATGIRYRIDAASISSSYFRRVSSPDVRAWGTEPVGAGGAGDAPPAPPRTPAPARPPRDRLVVLPRGLAPRRPRLGHRAGRGGRRAERPRQPPRLPAPPRGPLPVDDGPALPRRLLDPLR